MTTMSANTFLKVAPRLPANTSILIRGDHGIGKSQLGRQLAKLIAENEKFVTTYEVIDKRLSQLTEGDIIGLPSTDGEVTRFNPPDWYKHACQTPVFLFLDELNRATPEVMQAAFQIVLDRELNGWKLHPKTRVMSAANVSAAYNINEIDPALLDRFWVIDLFPTLEDWTTWAHQKNQDKTHGYNCLPLIVDFIISDQKWLDPPKNAEPGKVYVSRRSWERLGDALHLACISDMPKNELFYPMCIGYIGIEATIKFIDYVKMKDDQITGEEIVNHYDQIRHKIINNEIVEIFNIAIEKASKFVIELESLNDEQGNNLKTFMNDLPSGEFKISLWSKVIAKGIDKLELAKSIQKFLVKDVLAVFSVPVGEAGIGIIPNIPESFKDKSLKDQNQLKMTS